MTMESKYSPIEVEKKWEALHRGNGSFHPRGEGKPFTVVIPPPNVTGALHMGHALNQTIQDVLVRFERLRGRRTLWQPGTDHAGIATQNVVERALAKEGKKRREMGREAFLEQVWAWKNQYEARIVGQVQRMGNSCDWDRLRFTMDEGLSRAVRAAFVHLYEKGLIYRGKYIVNWCPKDRTALSDDEVETKDGGEPGHLWHLRYPLEDGSFLVVATTRPETLLGDTAVAVNPKDERYASLVGKRIRLPLTDRTIPVIADDFVEMDFGTGCVKVTPAHDPTDFGVFQRHPEIGVIDIMNEDASLNDEVPERFRGLDRYEARKRIVAEFEELGLLEKVEDRMTPIGRSYRSGEPIEYRLSDQWFVDMKPLAEKALASTREGRVKFVPERWNDYYCKWLENVRPWCISRQLWWGHRIPVWYDEDGVPVAALEAPAVHPKTGKRIVRQDDDVLDTWFSSGLWPFSTLGWPGESAVVGAPVDSWIQPEVKGHFPTDVLVTDRGIIFFWVARMVMMSNELTGLDPFHTVYIHGTILDDKGRKMSKSLGNGIDPLEMADQYGADAVRFSLLILSTEGQDIKLSPTKFEMGRNFANKLWNATRFVLPHLEGADVSAPALDPADRWIRSRLATVTGNVTKSLEACRFAEAAMELYHFAWGDFCSWYLELRKNEIHGDDGPAKASAVGSCFQVLDALTRLLNPFMPALSEELREHLGLPQAILSAWPVFPASAADGSAERAFALMISAVEAVRSLRGRYQIAPSRILSVVVRADDAQVLSDLRGNLAALRTLAGAEVVLQVGGGKPAFSGTEILSGMQVHVALEGILDKEAELARVARELSEAEKFAVSIRSKLGNESFVGRAKPEVVDAEREKLANQELRAVRLRETLAELAA
ncbi:MAG TPA: valine--tRNA ligase [Fibrobacteria bacterium]|nr:valine--tRNA ligase [Fibrobacteria bacterium]